MSERRPSLIVVSAPSGAGKSSVLARVLAETPTLRFSVSHTTRPPRPGEADGVAYHFVDEARFRELVRAEQFVEWAEVHGELKGTSWAEYEAARREGKDLLLDLDVQGAAQVRARFPSVISVFLLPPSFAALESRLRARAQDPEPAIRRRLHNARLEVALYRDYDYTVVNEDIQACVDAVKSIVQAARCRTSQVEELARRVVDTFGQSEEQSSKS